MIGQTISHYKILEKLGEGGMGVVYKAEDTKLDRLVALKFLPAHLAASEQDKARFIQEAKAASAINHPNICTIYSIDGHEGQMFIVMEFVDGQTLREKRGTISFKQAIDIGIQIADGLAAAHDKGIVHRDIKPENIMIRKDGIAQIMDFGLAKLRASGSKITRLTKEGSTVGTAGYMSPEQVQGQDTDHRSDIFSYGVLLYELLTGQLPFKGVHETALMYEIVNVDVAPMSSIKTEIDPSLDAIVLECLEKDPSERHQSTAEISKDLKRFKRESSRQRASRVTATRTAYQATTIPGRDDIVLSKQTVFSKYALVAWAGFGLAAIACASLLLTHQREKPSDNLKVHFTIATPKNLLSMIAASISPDGKTIAFIGVEAVSKTAVYVRSLDDVHERRLPGTENSGGFIWSPDSRNIALFFPPDKLKKYPLAGGPIETIAKIELDGPGLTWGLNGDILYVSNSSLYRVAASGGVPAPLTVLDSVRGETGHRYPSFLPDGRHFLFHITHTQSEQDGIYVASLDSPEKRQIIVKGAVTPAYATETGHLFYTREGTLVVQRFDLSGFNVLGELKPVAEDVFSSRMRRGWFGGFRVSSDAVLVYRTIQAGGQNLIRYGRSGDSLGIVGEVRSYNQIALSPDGKYLMASLVGDEKTSNADLWLIDLGRNVMSRFTSELENEEDPVWSPDSKSVAFHTDSGMTIKSLITGERKVLSLEPGFPEDWTRDGRYIVYGLAVGQKKLVKIYPLAGETKQESLMEPDYITDEYQVSPDGQWLAYVANESGRYEIYVQPFHRSGERMRISTNGGGQPRWRRDGKELFFLALDGRLMAADVKQVPNSIDIGTPKPLFDTHIRVQSVIDQYVVSNDGQQFIVITPLNTDQPPYHVLVNWNDKLEMQ